MVDLKLLKSIDCLQGAVRSVRYNGKALTDGKLADFPKEI